MPLTSYSQMCKALPPFLADSIFQRDNKREKRPRRKSESNNENRSVAPTTTRRGTVVAAGLSFSLDEQQLATFLSATEPNTLVPKPPMALASHKSDNTNETTDELRTNASLGNKSKKAISLSNVDLWEDGELGILRIEYLGISATAQESVSDNGIVMNAGSIASKIINQAQNAPDKNRPCDNIKKKLQETTELFPATEPGKDKPTTIGCLKTTNAKAALRVVGKCRKGNVKHFRGSEKSEKAPKRSVMRHGTSPRRETYDISSEMKKVSFNNVVSVNNGDQESTVHVMLRATSAKATLTKKKKRRLKQRLPDRDDEIKGVNGADGI